jgi:DNA-binding LacI/PurR family transcriptional regulator
MTSIRHLARLAGVSIATVSRALRDDPHVLPETKQRIVELAELHHYRSNRLVRGLVTGSSATIGCILPDLTVDFFSRLLRGVLRRTFLESYHVVVFESYSQESTCREALSALVEQRVEGILVAGGGEVSITSSSIFAMRSYGIIPVALDNSPAEMPLDRVHTDEDELAQQAVGYLMQLGHRRIAYIGPSGEGNRFSRSRAVLRAMKHCGLSHEYVRHTSDAIPAEAETQQIVRELMRLPNPPTAVIGFQGHTAARIIAVAHQQGIRVPHELSVLGCGTFHACDLVFPAITSIEQHPEDIGKAAIDLLLKRIADKREDEEFSPVTVTVPTSIIERASCSSPRRRY